MTLSDRYNWIIAILLASLLYAAIYIQRDKQAENQSSVITQSLLLNHLNFNQETLKQAEPIKTTQSKPVVNETAQRIEKTATVQQLMPQTQKRKNSDSSKHILKERRQQYLQKLLHHIESFKFYPGAARKRSIEGDVKISFILRDAGHYEKLIVDGKRSVLVNAARIAIIAASPLPVPDKNIELPSKINFTMVYSLTQLTSMN